MDKIEVKLNSTYWVLTGFLCIFYGAGFFIHYFYNNKQFPKTIDLEGLTTRKGHRFLWKDLTTQRAVSVYAGSSAGMKIAGTAELYFGENKVRVQLGMIENAKEVYDFLTAKVGIPLQHG